MLAFAAARAGAGDFNLTGLPSYDPGDAKVHGVVRIHDTELTQHLVHLWEDGFLKLHPLVRYGEYTVPAWFSGLCAGTADIAVTGHDAWRSDLKAFEGVFGYPPLEIMFATGGFDRRKGNTPGAIIFVNKDNPLTGLTLDQLDGILGAERSGGWVGTTWSTAAARGPEKNIRTWGQLGLTGEWADKPSHIFGIDATLSGWSGLIQKVVFHGGGQMESRAAGARAGRRGNPGGHADRRQRCRRPLCDRLQLHAGGGAQSRRQGAGARPGWDDGAADP